MGAVTIKSIKFSHNYTKFPNNPDPSTLLEVFVVDHDLHGAFVRYDTSIIGGGNYRLPSGKKLVLLLQSVDGVLWTTIRRHTDDKEAYYRRLRGKPIGIVMTPPVNQSLDIFS